jgi:hypothetical protein
LRHDCGKVQENLYLSGCDVILRSVPTLFCCSLFSEAPKFHLQLPPSSHQPSLSRRYAGRKVMLGVDRLDMIKGIPQVQTLCAAMVPHVNRITALSNSIVLPFELHAVGASPVPCANSTARSVGCAV